jgi:1,4-dihydroxy-2-naphthoyl-CoA hydrolase
MNVEYVSLTPTEGLTRVKVSDIMLQPNGILHGGISAWLAENCANKAAITGYDPEVAWPLGLNLECTHLLGVQEGDTIETHATLVRGGGRTQVWRIEQFRLSDGALFNVSQLTVYIKYLKKSGAQSGKDSSNLAR